MPLSRFNTPFEALRPLTEDETQEEETTQESLDDRFNRVLKGRFGDIPPGSRFASNLEGVVDITALSARISSGDDRAMIVVFYNSKNRNGETVEKHTTLSITESGSLSGQLPHELRRLTKDQILNEVLENLEAEGLDDWLVIQGGVIIPPGEWENEGKKSRGDEPRERAALDRDRFKFFRRQPELLCKIRPGEDTRIRYGSYGQYGPREVKAGLTDYHAFVFRRGVLFENAVTENNLYYHPFDHPLPEDFAQEMKNKQRDPEDIQQELFRRGFFATANKTKNELRLEGKRYPKKHPNHTWPEGKKKAFYNELQGFIESTMA